MTGIETGDPALLVERITCAKGSEDLKKCRSRVGWAMVRLKMWAGITC